MPADQNLLENFVIEKLVYGGEGLARMPGPDGRAQTVFVPFVLPGETVAANIIEQKRSFARAGLERVLSASEARVEPPCPYYLRCGGCHYQHAGYEVQLKLKGEILRETLERTARVSFQDKIRLHASPPFEYRNRTRVHVKTTPEFCLGYFRYGSHELLAIKQCPISSPLINQAIAALWEVGSRGEVPPELSEIEFFANHSDEQLLLELYLTQISEREKLKQFCQRFSERVPQLAGASSFIQSSGKNFAPQEEPTLLYGELAIQYETRAATYTVSAGSFFQTNRFLTDTLVQLVAADRRGALALDLYAGVGLFSLAIAGRFEQVVAVESAPASARDLAANARSNMKVSRQMTESFLEKAGRRARPELIIVDPPRFGLGERVTALLGRVAAQELVYVSCDPATLARDLKALIGHGWKLQEVNLIDLFPQTFHIETMTVLQR